MFSKSELRKGRAEDIARLTRDPERAPLGLFALARTEADTLTTQLRSFLSTASALTEITTQIEALISTTEERALGGIVQRIKLLLGAPTRELCIGKAVSLLDPMRLRLDSLAILATDVHESVQDLQVWADALRDAAPTLPECIRDSALGRAGELEAMIANGENALSSYAGLASKSEPLRMWALLAQRSLWN